MLRSASKNIFALFCSGKSQLSKDTSLQKQELDNHFGFKNIRTQQKQPFVDQVFHSVANKYDVMNDAMSMGVHRYWKNYFVQQLGNLCPNNFYSYDKQKSVKRVLDVAGGTGDISFRILQNHHGNNIRATVFDINQSMLDEGVKRARSSGYRNEQIQFICGNAEQLPFPDNTFDAYTISFGLRNVPRTRKALHEAHRVLKTGGRFMCLEFSKVQNPILRQIYRQYSFMVIPEMGKAITGDKQSYQYLVESIERFLTQDQLKNMMEQVGFISCSYENLTDGIVAIHSGFKNSI